MLCKVLYYNKPTHTLVVDYTGTRVQFPVKKYNGEKYVDIGKKGSSYSILTWADKRNLRLNKKIKQEEDIIKSEQPDNKVSEEDQITAVD